MKFRVPLGIWPGCAHQGALGDDVLGDPSCAIRLVSFWLEGIDSVVKSPPIWLVGRITTMSSAIANRIGTAAISVVCILHRTNHAF